MSDASVREPDDSGFEEAERRKLESLAAMATGIAHELNNHLAAIEGNNKLLLRLFGPDSEYSVHLKQIDAATQQALDLTSELGVYAGRLEPDRQSVVLAEMIDKLLPQWQKLTSQNQVIEIDLPDPCPVLEVDPDLLGGALSRLVANAQDATVEQAGKITVSARMENLTGELSDAAYADDLPAEGAYITIAVQDRGNGIAGAVRRRMFDPFFSTKIRGQGMGLPYVIGVARAHNGTVSFATGARGTSVRIHLPLGKS